MGFEAFLILREKRFHNPFFRPDFTMCSWIPVYLADILYRAVELLGNYSLTDISHSFF